MALGCILSTVVVAGNHGRVSAPIKIEALAGGALTALRAADIDEDCGAMDIAGLAGLASACRRAPLCAEAGIPATRIPLHGPDPRSTSRTC